jgi:hypothetical protein
MKSRERGERGERGVLDRQVKGVRIRLGSGFFRGETVTPNEKLRGKKKEGE